MEMYFSEVYSAFFKKKNNFFLTCFVHFRDNKSLKMEVSEVAQESVSSILHAHC